MLLNINKNFTTVECFKCGVMFAVTNELNGYWLRDKTTFYCPNGHSQSYSESTAEKLKKQLDERQSEIAQKNSEIWDLEQKLKKATKPKKRGRPRKT
jgi:hypothetical protein